MLFHETVQNAAKVLSKAKPSLAGKELVFDTTQLATQLFLGNISRQGHVPHPLCGFSCSAASPAMSRSLCCRYYDWSGAALLLHGLRSSRRPCFIDVDGCVKDPSCFSCSEWGDGVAAMRADLSTFGSIERLFIVHNPDGLSKVAACAICDQLCTCPSICL